MPEPRDLTTAPQPSSLPSSAPTPASPSSASQPALLVALGNVANKLFAWSMAAGLFYLWAFKRHEMDSAERKIVLGAILGLSVAADRLVDLSKAASRVVSAWKGGKAE